MSLDLEVKFLSIGVRQVQTLNERRAVQVGFDIALQLDQPLGQFDV